jgi:23S rRNA (cytidine1920-2'-O)/16S rRNA (cytidine1409-2'-O)-methyltransferase
MRLDHYLCQQHYTDSRSKAKALIDAKKVKIDGVIVTKPAFSIDVSNPPEVEILQSHIYVSRAAMKLKGFLSDHPVAIAGRACLDIGSSTGGFVEVLLEEGAASVTGVDVGSGQLHANLRNDPRVKSVEQTDIRDFQSDRAFDVVTCDVSFVGIGHILPDIDRLAKDDIILLFKPQFEVGKEAARTKKGVVKSTKVIEKAVARFEAESMAYGWELIEKRESRTKGKEGNVEIFFHFKKR